MKDSEAAMSKQASKRATEASTSTSEGPHASEAADAVEKIARLTERNKKAQVFILVSFHSIFGLAVKQRNLADLASLLAGEVP